MEEIREPYWNYMAKRLNEEDKDIMYNNIKLTTLVDELYDRVKRLEEEISWLKK